MCIMSITVSRRYLEPCALLTGYWQPKLIFEQELQAKMEAINGAGASELDSEGRGPPVGKARKEEE